MLKINVKDGELKKFETHINEILLPREASEVMSAFRVVVEPGRSTHAHAHKGAEQLFYVLSGSGKAVLKPSGGAEEEAEILPEDVLHVPRNTEHQVFCTSADEPLTYLCVDGYIGANNVKDVGVAD